MIVEWSTTRCDYRYIYVAAEKINFTRLMPSVENNVCCILPLKRKATPGLSSFSLPILFDMIAPKSPVVLRAHAADMDTLMFSIIFALMYYGRKEEFLIYCENYRDNSEG